MAAGRKITQIMLQASDLLSFARNLHTQAPELQVELLRYLTGSKQVRNGTQLPQRENEAQVN